MVSQPKLHQVHEDLLAGQMRIVEKAGLGVPVVAQLAAYLLPEEGELMKLLLGLVAEQVELRVVVNLVLLRPLALARRS